MEKTGAVLPCPKCGSRFLAWGKPFRSTTPRLIVLLGSRRRIVCCMMCGYYAPVKDWNREEQANEKQMKNIRQQRADERDKTAQIFTWCMVVAMHQEEGIGATRLERACNEMHEFQQRYKTKILTENRKSATDAMREDLKGICDFEVRLPQTKAPRNRKEEQLRMAQNEGAEIAWLVMAATTHLTFGFGKERLARLKRETLDNYRQYIGWVEQDGEAYAMELLCRCSEQALQEELKVNDMRESKNHILPGGFAETQSADMLRAMEAVSAKMAAERGIKRVPLAVLSQSEVTRRMKSI